METKKEFTPDEKDRRILELLQEDSSQPIRKIAEDGMVKLAVPTVSERIKKLEDAKIIKRYTVFLDDKKLGKDITAFVGITLDYNIPETENVITNEVTKMKDILECHHLAGEEDYLVKVKTENTSTLEAIINVINRLPGVRRTRTVIVLSTDKEETVLSLT